MGFTLGMFWNGVPTDTNELPTFALVFAPLCIGKIFVVVGTKGPVIFPGGLLLTFWGPAGKF